MSLTTSARRPLAASLALAMLLCVAQSRSTAAQSVAAPARRAAVAERDGQHDFDFEFGAWSVHLKRRSKPLTGSQVWSDLTGTSVVRRVWNGQANLGELDVRDSTTHIVGLSLRLYNPVSRQWSIYWANAADGDLGTAMVGQFVDGRGEFYNQEMFQGKAIFVRFIFSNITPTSFQIEQAFSQDGGKTWETNWISSFTREKER